MGNRRMFLRLITGSLLRRSSRMLAALLAVGVGATVLYGMIAVYLDMPDQLEREFRSYGANLLLVPSGERGIMSLGDIAAAARALPREKVLGIAPYRYESLSLNRQPVTAAGTSLKQAKKTSPYWNLEGAWPEKLNEMILGAEVAEYLGLAPGREARLSGRTRDGKQFSADLRITGTLKTGGAEEGMIFLELAALERLLGGKGEAGAAEVSVAASAEELERLAEAVHAAAPAVTARLVKRVASSEAKVVDKLQALVFLVTAVALGLTMICVATTMMAVVMERRREIGLKKAIGADSRSIVLEFLGEAAALGLAGGAIGALVGRWFAALVGESVFQRSVSVGFYVAPAVILLAAMVTVLASLAPVGKAAGVEPALVLKGE